jgi:hypothetical protein
VGDFGLSRAFNIHWGSRRLDWLSRLSNSALWLSIASLALKVIKTPFAGFLMYRWFGEIHRVGQHRHSKWDAITAAPRFCRKWRNSDS